MSRHTKNTPSLPMVLIGHRFPPISTNRIASTSYSKQKPVVSFLPSHTCFVWYSVWSIYKSSFHHSALAGATFTFFNGAAGRSFAVLLFLLWPSLELPDEDATWLL